MMGDLVRSRESLDEAGEYLRTRRPEVLRMSARGYMPETGGNQFQVTGATLYPVSRARCPHAHPPWHVRV